MLFNSLVFFVFFVVFFSVWPLAKRKDKSRWWCIVIFSFIFYGWWDWRFLFLILFSGLIDYFTGLAMHSQPERKKQWLFASIIGNVGGLAVFKYSGFVAESLDGIIAFFGFHTDIIAHLPEFSLIVPVGISFYTFQSMSYTIDVYRNKLTPTRNIAHFFAFLAMFPQLVAGPIVRAKDLLFQLDHDRKVSASQLWFGLRLMVYGFFQKMVIADNLAPLVNKAFWNINTQPSALFWWLIMLAFSFQIYFDFAGYSSIARGLAKLMGFRFRSNFNHPYHAVSLKDFWSRWHISLSTWFRDYVYIPLGGGRSSKWKWYRNMWITMLVSGLWHGPAGHFILWGGVHAAFLSFERYTRWPKLLHSFKFGKAFAFVFVMFQVIVAWVFFRAENVEQASVILSSMFSLNTVGNDFIFEEYFNTIVFLALAVGVECWYFIKRKKPALRFLTRNVLYDCITMAVLITLCIYFRGPASEFIYFQF